MSMIYWIVSAYLVIVAWGAILLITVQHTDNTWRGLWLALCEPMRSHVPRAVARLDNKPGQHSAPSRRKP